MCYTEDGCLRALHKCVKKLGNGCEWIEPHNEIGVIRDGGYKINIAIERLNLVSTVMFDKGPVVLMKGIHSKNEHIYSDDVTLTLSLASDDYGYIYTLIKGVLDA